jgi:hypothetical protein
MSEFSALIKHLNKDNHDNPDVIYCAEFLVMFFRLGFAERNTRIKMSRIERKRLQDEKEKKLRDDKAILEQKNALKCKATRMCRTAWRKQTTMPT